MAVELREGVPEREAYFELFETTGWNAEYGARPENLEAVNRNSWFCVGAYEGDRLVGFGRLVSDGLLHAMVYDMIVHPDFQRRGVGSAILQRLLRECEDHAIRDVQLFCARGKRGFYEKHAFEARPDEAPGMQRRKAP